MSSTVVLRGGRDQRCQNGAGRRGHLELVVIGSADKWQGMGKVLREKVRVIETITDKLNSPSSNANRSFNCSFIDQNEQNILEVLSCC